MKKQLVLSLLLVISYSSAQLQSFTMSKEALKNKIKGGWAGQTIGVTYGAPVEFRYNGTMINDYHKLEWNDTLIRKSMLEAPGIYDDLYMDITFVEVFEKEGFDAPLASHAHAIANAGYMLWHANQAARYNILNGIEAPQSGYWVNNPHADCIDYQIEADFSGLMSPGMPNTASAISDKIGHIMNYGDGWYGGVYMGAMYALAFTNNNIETVVNEGLKTIPKESKFYKCIADVIQWHKQYPNDWKQTWFEIQKKWTNDIGCPDGVYQPFNIDATVNAAYVVLGLLYGNGDFTQTIEITTRCGQDADCNPSSAGGILGTLIGYDAIPNYWLTALKQAENIDFKYTSTSLNKVYAIGTKHALDNIIRNGGKISGDQVSIQTQIPKSVHFEESFTNLQPQEKKWIGKTLKDEVELELTGNGFVIKGENKLKSGFQFNNQVTTFELYIDGKFIEQIKLPVNFTTRRHEICWKYQLKNSSHKIKLKRISNDTETDCLLSEIITYTSIN